MFISSINMIKLSLLRFTDYSFVCTNSLNKTMRPSQDLAYRKFNSLKLWILEAKNVAAKKR